MDMRNQLKKVPVFLNKYKYVALILLIGLALMAIPSKTETEPQIQTQEIKVKHEEETISDQLSSLLSEVDGAGKVKVMLTIATGEETVFQIDENKVDQENTSSLQTNTVIITDAQRDENGLVRHIKAPVFRGAIVVCQGADSPIVRLAIIDAVSKITGLGSDKISVLKMK